MFTHSWVYIFSRLKNNSRDLLWVWVDGDERDPSYSSPYMQASYIYSTGKKENVCINTSSVRDLDETA